MQHNRDAQNGLPEEQVAVLKDFIARVKKERDGKVNVIGPFGEENRNTEGER